MRGPSSRHAGCRGLELRDVDRLRALVPALLLVVHAGALREGAVPVGDDAGVMDEEVAGALVGRDEPEALVVAEPLHGAGGHLRANPPVRCAAYAEDGPFSYARTSCAREWCPEPSPALTCGTYQADSDAG